uniref:Prolactin receptor n=1 Tax=Tetraodon nigroviridis TaxID=99883 RepID=H3DDQ6_TETNG
MTRDVMRTCSTQLVLLLLLSAAGDFTSTSPPGKPVLLGCRSPEKETFSCWWLPGSAGGLPTTHRLFYNRDRLTGEQECPDYESAGNNSCFFNKSHTSIWDEYSLTVVAFNALGNVTSDPLKIEVMKIVKPNPPKNVTLLVEEIDKTPNLHITWEPPFNVIVKSGWITLKYGLRVKQGNNGKWKEYLSGKQTHYSMYSISPGATYTVQVRCRLDHGSWSEWSDAASKKVPNFLEKGKPFWIFVSMLFAVPFLAAMCVLAMKWNYVKQRILPPVPGPKIIGFDFKHLKAGQPEDLNTLLFNQNFPLMEAWRDQMDDYLIVTEIDKNKNFIIPTIYCAESEIQHQESTCLQKEPEKVGTGGSNNFVLGEGIPIAEPFQSADRQTGSGFHLTPLNPTENSLLDCENTFKPHANGGYVDIATHPEHMQKDNSAQRQNAQRQVKSWSEDYSRVKDVNGVSVVFLETAPVYTTTKEKDYTDFACQETKTPCETALNEGTSTGAMESGYVDTVPHTARI